MSKPIILAAAGALVGVVAAFAAFTFLLGGGETAEAAPPTEVVNVPDKLGPHITLTDRVFNLLPEPGSGQVYLKLQAIIEFETTDLRWKHVLNSCHDVEEEHAPAATETAPEGAPTEAAPAHGARTLPLAGDVLVSSVPGGAAVEVDRSSAGPAGDPCEAEQAALLAEFEHEIGTGRALIEDAVTSIVTGHTVSEIETPEGKEALKAEIEVAVEALTGDLPVHRVLFVNFITQ